MHVATAAPKPPASNPAVMPPIEMREIEAALPWEEHVRIMLGPGFPDRVARRYAPHARSLPALHITLRHGAFDPATGMLLLPPGGGQGQASSPAPGQALPWSCFFGSGHPRAAPEGKAALARAAAGMRRIDAARVYCGFNRHWRNYAHWLTQCLPAIALYATEPGFADSVLLLPRLNRDWMASIDLAGITLPRVAWVEDETVIAAEEIVFSSLLLHHYAPSLISRAVFDAMAASCAGGPDYPPRVYVWRADATSRPMRNEDDLVQRLAARGFDPIVTGLMPIEEQIRRFRAAKLIVGPHGAGLGNLLFCRPGATVYELLPDHWIDSFVGPSINLFAQLRGVDYWADAFTAHGSFATHGHDVPWTVDIDRVMARIDEIEAA